MSRPLELPAPRVVGVFSPGIARIPHLAAFLGAERVVLAPTPLTRVDAVVGWGRKPNTARARRAAERRGVPYLTLEDGFLRSLDLGVKGAPPLSIVVDDAGVYYDATSPSRLERMLASSPDALDPPALARARRAIARIREERLSKYNAAPLCSLGPRERPRVLVVDQTAGDLSLARGLCVERPFDAMLRAALDEHPHAEIIVKTHPDVASGKKRGHFSSLRASARVRLLSQPVNPIALLEEVDSVYVATSLLGFEALLVGREVTCFGVPFYAGWGLTDDRAPVPRRRARRSLEALFTAAYLRYARYVDPETGERCELERIIEHLALQRRLAEENARTSVCVGFSIWKRGFLPAFLASPRGEVRFAKDAEAARHRLEGAERARVVVWGTREGDALREVAAERGAPIWRMEDGFLRSVGLGTDLYAPASLVLDREGIYYDPRTPSDLERILAEAKFSDEERARARLLRERIVEAGITKYNLGPRRELASQRESGGREVVLVVGQVEADASIALGTLDVRRNEELLLAARRARPHAYLVYKPHPDVVSKNREDSLPLAVARRMCDEVVTDASLADCLRAASEVHTMTSLVGFEALLRGLAVSVYGQPFYAGWGLTTDRHPHPRRSRRLTLDELVAGALIRYPRYVHPVSGAFTTPEAIVEHLARARERGPRGWQERWPSRQGRKLVNLAKGALGVS